MPSTLSFFYLHVFFFFSYENISIKTRHSTYKIIAFLYLFFAYKANFCMDLQDADLGWLLLVKSADYSAKSVCIFADTLTSSGCIIDLWIFHASNSGMSNWCDGNGHTLVWAGMRRDRKVIKVRQETISVNWIARVKTVTEVKREFLGSTS